MSFLKYPLVVLLFAAAAFALAALWYLGARRKSALVKKVFSPRALEVMNAQFWRAGAKAKDILFVTGVALIFLALAGPQWGIEKVDVRAEVSYTVIAVDVSSSMKAMDLKPSRIENAKTMLKILITNLKDSRIGIVAFTSKAYVQAPVTNDTAALKYFVNNLRADMLNAKGTSIYAAVDTAVNILSKYPGKKALVLLTDGEDHTPEELQSAINIAKTAAVKIIAVGIGTQDGELIPQRVEAGQIVEYKKDKDGKTVVSKLGEKTLKELAAGTGGVYIKYASFQNAAAQITRALEDLDKETRDLKSAAGYINRYQIPLFAGILLILISLTIPLKKVKL